MPKWIEYVLKKKPADEDMLMLEDAESKSNKRVSFSGIADWLIEKMKKNNLISGALRFKGSSSYAALPGKGAAENDYYYCTDGDGTHGPGYYAWNGSSWIWIGNNDKGIDKSLKVEGAAAEAAATGEAIASLKEDIANNMDANGLVINSFDGEFQNGYYSSSDGVFILGNSDNEVCIKNKIRCAENDIIIVTFPIEISSSRCLIYDSSNNLIFTKYFGKDGVSVTGVKKYKITVPQGGMWFAFNATKHKNVINGTTVYINQINVADSIQKNATDIQKNATDIQKNATDIQKNATDIQNMQSVLVNDKRNFIRLTIIKSAKLLSITNISKYPSRIEITGKNILNILTKIDGKIKNDSGIEISDGSFYYNQYIPVIPKERIYINFGVQRIYQYDTNIAWLRRTQVRNETKIFGEYIIPDDCYFIQVQTNRKAINLDKAMIVRFTENLDYEEYKYYAVNIQNENELPLSITVYSENTTIYCGENVEAAVKYNGLTGITIPACKTYGLWEPSEATDDYKSGIGMGNTKISLSISDFLGDYYDVYLGNHNGYKVIKRSLGRDESNDYELLEYQFIPKHYNRTVLLSSGMNANELSPMFGLAYLIKAIMDGTNDPGINYLRENVRLVVLPSINPWGFDQNPMNYYNSNHVRINKNFDYNGSWKLMPSNEYPGTAADSEAETKILKCWINQYANQAELWIDCHSDAFGNSPHLHQVITSSSDVGTIIGKVQQKITDYYVEKGYIADGTIDAVKPSWWTSPLTNYPKTVYSEKICGIKALMIEQYVNGTFYGSDGKYNNDSYDIKNYALMLRAFILAILESDEKTIDVNDIYWMAYHKVTQ